jgi:hypothetical protein
MNPIVNIKTLVRPGTNTLLRLDTQFGQGGWCYVGWAHQCYGLTTSPLANPYTHLQVSRAGRLRVAGRDEAIQSFRQWLWEQPTTGNRAIRSALQAITPDTVLICWCAPLDCHAEVIARAATWLRTPPHDAEPSPPATPGVPTSSRGYVHLRGSFAVNPLSRRSHALP